MDSVKTAFIELFELHIPAAIPLTPGISRDFYFCNSGNVTFTRGGATQQYVAFPIAISGIAQTSSGAPPRPKLSLSTVDPLVSQLAFLYSDIVGTKVVYIRTFEEYLSSGIGSYPLNMEILAKTSHNKNGLEFELRFPTDRETDYLPKKQMLRNEYPGMGTNKRAM
jgi:lambda family phage minor tail protein L